MMTVDNKDSSYGEPKERVYPQITINSDKSGKQLRFIGSESGWMSSINELLHVKPCENNDNLYYLEFKDGSYQSITKLQAMDLQCKLEGVTYIV